MKKVLHATVMTVAILVLASCESQEPTSSAALSGGQEGGAEASFAFGTLEAALTPGEVKKVAYFRIRIYEGTPATEDAEALFDSLASNGCFKAGGPEVTIKDLKAGDDRFIFYQGYTDANCTDLYALGMRGGVKIQASSALQEQAAQMSCENDKVCKDALHPDARCNCAKEKDSDGKDTGDCAESTGGLCTISLPIFIPVYAVGKFNRLPVPSESLRAEATTKSCDNDLDCQDFHKAATCNDDLGYCTVDGLFPFAPAKPRAFHTASVLPDGKVLFVGGFTHTDGSGMFYAEGPFFEVFNPVTGLFERPSVQENWGGQNVAFHRASALAGSKLVVSGGVSQAALSYEQGVELMLRWRVPGERDADCSGDSCRNFSKFLVLADAADGSSLEIPLLSDDATGHTGRMIGHRAAFVRQGADLEMLLMSGGLVFGSGGQPLPSKDYVWCNAKDLAAKSLKTFCEVAGDRDKYPERYSHADVCLLGGESGKPCDEYFLFGGVAEGEPSGEGFSSDMDSFSRLFSFNQITSLNRVHFPELISAEFQEDEPAKLYTFGGVSEVEVDSDAGGWYMDFPAPDIQPRQVNVNLTTTSLTIAEVDIQALDPQTEVYRLFHSVTALEDEPGKPQKIMLAGGVGADNLPRKSVLFFEDPATHALTYAAAKNLNEARFGHTATVLTKGFLKGAVLVVGGFTVADKASGAISFADGAELYIP
jgi:hypothetical protein